MKRKKRIELSRLLDRKLDILGVANEPKLRQIGNKPILTIKDEKIVEGTAPVYQLHNLRRQMISKILEGGEGAARAFLAMDNQALKGALVPQTDESPTPSAEEAND
jgi:hypothetical protein